MSCGLCFLVAVSSVPPNRADIITESQAKGLGNFVSKFALPALLFKNMVLLDFGDVIWAFLWSVLVAKVGVCASVCYSMCMNFFYFIAWWLKTAPFLCVGDGVCAGVCADPDGGQSGEQIQ